MLTGLEMIRWFADASMEDVEEVGGKGASLGEMYQALHENGVLVPNGFTVTVQAYATFVDTLVPEGSWMGVADADDLPGLRDKAASCATLREAITTCFDGADTSDHLEMHARTALVRALIEDSEVPADVAAAISAGYEELCEEYGPGVDVAVRSSATVEDSAEASFAGQYESFLNVHGTESVVLHWKRCVASLFTERAVAYQIDRDMDPLNASLAVVIMKMVRSDLACSGVMFTLDPDSGHDGVIHISSAFGLGELLVQGTVSPDNFLVWKEGLLKQKAAIVHRHMGQKEHRMVYAASGRSDTDIIDVGMEERRTWSLTSQEVLALADMAIRIEQHYGRPMDIEWAKDGRSNDLFIVQARPETVHGAEKPNVLTRYVMDTGLLESLRRRGKVLATGQAVGERIGSGKVRVYGDYDDVIRRKRALRDRLADGEVMDEITWDERVFEPGDVLVTEMTTPDWEPLMKQAALIITRKGGRTSHAAIIAREFGIPAIVGCIDALRVLEEGMEVTGTCAEGDEGLLLDGIHPFEIDRIEINTDVPLRTKLKLNVGFPTKSLADSMLPVDGVGLARIEFILSAEVGIHPLALVHHDDLLHYHQTGEISTALEAFRPSLEMQSEEKMSDMLNEIEQMSGPHEDARHLFIDSLKEGVGLICAAFHPRPVLVRLSDFKSNEYRELVGGAIFEPLEENPMIAWRGASRYVDPKFAPAFDMECEALRGVVHEFGLDNLQLMVPFCRSPEEGAAVKDMLDASGLGKSDGVPLFIMVELPSNVILADEFIESMELDGGSIGTNDLVQTVYAVSRDDLEGYLHPVDARSPAVKTMVRKSIEKFTAKGLEIGICGQAPSDHPESFPPFLIDCGITSISVTPDTAIQVRIAVEAAEAAVDLGYDGMDIVMEAEE
ncbi:MAG: PEP/pyruvate-binding domain-containing protein [Candidatus Thermoplasmatota archaeon]|nr:PEP/pyruvate-binding domain-containing protein [Candidatus Thermoplasmatota archaeon]